MVANEKWFGGAGAGAGFYSYNIQNSLRFDENAGDHLTRTPSYAGNRKIWTWSCWFKRSNLGNTGNDMVLFGADAGDGGATYTQIRILASNTPYDAFEFNGNGGVKIAWTPLLRDISGFYHFCVAVDTTQSTNTNRVKFWLNGVQVTTTSTANWMSQDADLQVNNTTEHQIGELRYNASTELDGYMADMVLLDGTATDYSSFAEFKNNVLVPKNPSGLSFGTNGVHLKFASGALGADSSGNSNTYTLNNIDADHSSIDTPSSGAGS
tara:strand:+ start:9416 stop:10213 length:798 start_codon:yes stop_codon:yes gene_type:complete